MANVIYRDKGPNFQVPGLPYQEKYNFVEPLVLDGMPTYEQIQQLIEASPDDTLTNPWTVSALHGFKTYIPTTFRRITRGMGEGLAEELFGPPLDSNREYDRLTLQLQTEIESKGATIDAAMIHGRRDIGTVVNKAHILNRLHIIGGLYGHLGEREYPILFGDLTDENNWDDALSQMKQLFIEYLLEIPVGPRNYEVITRQPQCSQKEIDEKYPYIEWLKNKLGDNLTGVLLYGSAARSDNPDDYSDFDNWVKVRDVGSAHKVLRGTIPTVYLGKMYEGVHFEGDDHDAKHVGIHLLPDSDEYIARFTRFLHDSWEFRDHTRVLIGEFPFPLVSLDEVVERGLSAAHVKLKTIAGSLNWAYFSPEQIQGKPSLFEYIVKNVRFFLQHSLNAHEGYDFRNKQELNELLRQRGMVVPEYSSELPKIQTALIQAMVDVLELQHELIETGRQTNLDFLVEHRAVKEADTSIFDVYDESG